VFLFLITFFIVFSVGISFMKPKEECKYHTWQYKDNRLNCRECGKMFEDGQT